VENNHYQEETETFRIDGRRNIPQIVDRGENVNRLSEYGQGSPPKVESMEDTDRCISFVKSIEEYDPLSKQLFIRNGVSTVENNHYQEETETFRIDGRRNIPQIVDRGENVNRLSEYGQGSPPKVESMEDTDRCISFVKSIEEYDLFIKNPVSTVESNNYQEKTENFRIEDSRNSPQIIDRAENVIHLSEYGQRSPPKVDRREEETQKENLSPSDVDKSVGQTSKAVQNLREMKIGGENYGSPLEEDKKVENRATSQILEQREEETHLSTDIVGSKQKMERRKEGTENKLSQRKSTKLFHVKPSIREASDRVKNRTEVKTGRKPPGYPFKKDNEKESLVISLILEQEEEEVIHLSSEIVQGQVTPHIVEREEERDEIDMDNITQSYSIQSIISDIAEMERSSEGRKMGKNKRNMIMPMAMKPNEESRSGILNTQEQGEEETNRIDLEEINQQTVDVTQITLQKADGVNEGTDDNAVNNEENLEESKYETVSTTLVTSHVLEKGEEETYEIDNLANEKENLDMIQVVSMKEEIHQLAADVTQRTLHKVDGGNGGMTQTAANNEENPDMIQVVNREKEITRKIVDITQSALHTEDGRDEGTNGIVEAEMFQSSSRSFIKDIGKETHNSDPENNREIETLDWSQLVTRGKDVICQITNEDDHEDSVGNNDISASTEQHQLAFIDNSKDKCLDWSQIVEKGKDIINGITDESEFLTTGQKLALEQILTRTQGPTLKAEQEEGNLVITPIEASGREEVKETEQEEVHQEKNIFGKQLDNGDDTQQLKDSQERIEQWSQIVERGKNVINEITDQNEFLTTDQKLALEHILKRTQSSTLQAEQEEGNPVILDNKGNTQQFRDSQERMKRQQGTWQSLKLKAVNDIGCKKDEVRARGKKKLLQSEPSSMLSTRNIQVTRVGEKRQSVDTERSTEGLRDQNSEQSKQPLIDCNSPTATGSYLQYSLVEKYSLHEKADSKDTSTIRKDIQNQEINKQKTARSNRLITGKEENEDTVVLRDEMGLNETCKSSGSSRFMFCFDESLPEISCSEAYVSSTRKLGNSSTGLVRSSSPHSMSLRKNTSKSMSEAYSSLQHLSHDAIISEKSVSLRKHSSKTTREAHLSSPPIVTDGIHSNEPTSLRKNSSNGEGEIHSRLPPDVILREESISLRKISNNVKRGKHSSILCTGIDTVQSLDSAFSPVQSVCSSLNQSVYLDETGSNCSANTLLESLSGFSGSVDTDVTNSVNTLLDAEDATIQYSGSKTWSVGQVISLTFFRS